MTRTLHWAPLALVATLAFGGCAKSTPVVDAGATFLAQNAKTPDIHVTPSGLQYRVLKSGPENGVHPNSGSEVKVRRKNGMPAEPASR